MTWQGAQHAIAALTALILLGTDMAAANAPSRSLRPVAREDVFPPALPALAPYVSLRPRQRPQTLAVAPQQLPRAVIPKPERQQNAVQRKQAGIGRVCGNRALLGTEVGTVPARLRGCGVRKAVKLHSVSGVALSTPAVMECDTAHALKSWVDRGVTRAVGRTGGGVVKLQVAAGYSCRTRNNRPGAKISEHGKGRAIDISAFHLKNGDRISVLKDWGRGKKGRILKALHKSACGPFGTVLGPNADKYHRDHFHFDVARHRSGPYCR
ncbi:extensin family protein [Cognatishimia sp. SS12]|uniref:extensin-like domain-containing protein n=1 Tax=Cognatishimia sp. SS12 TaxID=2979465 RepID=UPI00232AB983|nr:extensin family protein [Cognatishimia sp. SS12]MDC0738863.1 extensin family protein [Cognatishimia sp. SS12]